MIAVFIFYLHAVGAVYAFSRGFCKDSLVDGFMSVGFVALIFSVSWTIAGFLVRFLVPDFHVGNWLDPDVVSLLIVAALETVLYTFYFRSQRPALA
jgi:hypothetical protein